MKLHPTDRSYNHRVPLINQFGERFNSAAAVQVQYGRKTVAAVTEVITAALLGKRWHRIRWWIDFSRKPNRKLLARLCKARGVTVDQVAKHVVYFDGTVDDLIE